MLYCTEAVQYTCTKVAIVKLYSSRTNSPGILCVVRTKTRTWRWKLNFEFLMIFVYCTYPRNEGVLRLAHVSETCSIAVVSHDANRKETRYKEEKKCDEFSYISILHSVQMSSTAADIQQQNPIIFLQKFCISSKNGSSRTSGIRSFKTFKFWIQIEFLVSVQDSDMKG